MLIEIDILLFMMMHLKISSENWQPFCLGFLLTLKLYDGLGSVCDYQVSPFNKFYFFSRTFSELNGNCGIIAKMFSTMNSTILCVGVSKREMWKE